MEAELGGDAKLNRGGISWAVFEGGRDPYVILMTIYIFMPYVASTMVGNRPIRRSFGLRTALILRKPTRS